MRPETVAGEITIESVEEVCLGRLSDLSICARPPVGRYRVGCVHEHLRTVALCDRCAEWVEAKRGLCRICLVEVPDRHECTLIGRRLP